MKYTTRLETYLKKQNYTLKSVSVHSYKGENPSLEESAKDNLRTTSFLVKTKNGTRNVLPEFNSIQWALTENIKHLK